MCSCTQSAAGLQAAHSRGSTPRARTNGGSTVPGCDAAQSVARGRWYAERGAHVRRDQTGKVGRRPVMKSTRRSHDATSRASAPDSCMQQLCCYVAQFDFRRNQHDHILLTSIYRIMCLNIYFHFVSEYCQTTNSRYVWLFISMARPMI